MTSSSNDDVGRTQSVASYPAVSVASPGITIVIPTRNSPDLLNALAQSISSQLKPADQIIIVDGSDDSKTAARARELGFTVLRLASNRIEARLKGVQLARSPWICLVDADMVLDSRFLLELAKMMRTDTVAAVTPLELAWGTGRWFDLLRVQDQVEFGSGEGLPRCFRREVFLAFDWEGLLRLTHSHGEDRLFRDWLIRRNYAIVHAPKAVVYHRDPEVGKFLLKQFQNTREGTRPGLPSSLARGVVRTLVNLSNPRIVFRVAGSIPVAFGYYWFLVSRIFAQSLGMANAILLGPTGRDSKQTRPDSQG